MRPLTAALLWLLLAQFLAGMAVNLFVALPAVHPGVGAPGYFVGLARGLPWAALRGPVLLRVHVWVGVLLLAGATALLIMAVARARAVWPAALGWVGITGAAFNGGSFVEFGQGVFQFRAEIG